VLVLVLGHEQRGIPPEALDRLDAVVEIRLVGTAAGLNAPLCRGRLHFVSRGLRVVRASRRLPFVSLARDLGVTLRPSSGQTRTLGW
jgi:hypothetical protein